MCSALAKAIIVSLALTIADCRLTIVLRTADWGLDCGLGIGLRIGDWIADWGIGLRIGDWIGDWIADWGLDCGLGIGLRIEGLDWGLMLLIED
jgi:hypothetical protein